MIETYGISISEVTEETFRSGLFSCVEYCQSQLLYPDSMKRVAADVARLNELRQKYPVAVRSFHLPFGSTEYFNFTPASLDDNEKAETFANTKQLIEIVKNVGIKVLILHASVRFPPEERGLRLDSFVDYVQTLCDYCKKDNLKVAVETLKPRCIGNSLKEHLYIQEKAKRDNLGICFDSNHLLDEDNLAFLRGAGEYVIATHLSDFDGIDERHWFPGKGINDWKAITSILESKGYDAPYLFEVNLPEEEGKSLTDHYEDMLRLWREVTK